MYRNGKSSYQVKKEKLQKIKKEFQQLQKQYEEIKPMVYWKSREDLEITMKNIWEIVKDE